MAVRLAVSLLVAALTSGGALAAHWNGRWVQSNLGSGGSYNSVAIDPSGHPHVMHLTWRGPTPALAHAWFDGKRWRREIVDATDAGWGSAIAIDARGAISVAYQGMVDHTWALKFARFADGVWKTEIVETGGFAVAIALDADGNAYVSHVGVSDQVRVARRDAQGWVTESVATTGLYFGGTAIAVGPDGEEDVVFTQRRQPDMIVWAHKAGAVWSLSDVDAGIGPHLARDAAGHLHEAHVDDLSATIRYALNRGQGWEVEALLLLTDPQNPTLVRPDKVAVAVDAIGRPYLSVTASASGVEGIGYGWKEDGMWRPKILSTGNVGFETAIAVTPGGVPVIAARRPRRSTEMSNLYVFRLVGTPALGVRVKPRRAGTVTSDPAGLACDAACRTPFAPRTPVALIAAPAEGWTFQGWSGARTGIDPKCDVTMDRTKRVTARFSH